MTLLIALEFDQPQTTSFSAWLIGLTLEQVDAEITHSKQTRPRQTAGSRVAL